MADAAPESITFPRRRLGRYLRRGREAVGMTTEEAAKFIGCSKPTLNRCERGEPTTIRWTDVQALCQVYQFDEETTLAMVGLARTAAVKSWWHEFGDVIPENFGLYMDLEAGASKLVSYQPDLVPGLLQTPAYSEALVRTVLPDASDADVKARVEVRSRRQVLIRRAKNPIVMDVLLSEAVLRRMIGGRAVMAEQLRALVDLSSLDNITVRVVPFAAGSPVGEPMSPFVILDFPRDSKGAVVDPPVVYLEGGFTGAMYSEKGPIVDKMSAAWGRIQRAALDTNETKNLLRQTIKEYRA